MVSGERPNVFVVSSRSYDMCFVVAGEAISTIFTSFTTEDNDTRQKVVVHCSKKTVSNRRLAAPVNSRKDVVASTPVKVEVRTLSEKE